MTETPVLAGQALAEFDDIEPANARILQPEDCRIAVCCDPTAALDPWTELEALAPASIYQTRRFAIPWLDTIGRDAGLTPMIVVVSDAAGRPLALFPFAVHKRHGVTRAEFLGAKDSNSNLGLFDPAISWNAKTLRHVLESAARLSTLRPDAYILANQPERWDDFDNPLALLPHQPSPSNCHSTRLMPDSEAFMREKLSGDARKKLRAKRRKLEEIGPVSLLTARTEAEAVRILDTFFAQKLQRFDEKNIHSGFDSPAARSFFARCCISRIGRRDASVELHGLLAGERIVATYGGGVHRGRFHGMINSFEQDPAIARSSPGDLLLSLLIESKCRQGLNSLDLGIGEGRYKQTWCDRVEPLFDTLIPLTAKGHAFVYADALRRRVKRAIKQDATAWTLAQTIRRRLWRGQ